MYKLMYFINEHLRTYIESIIIFTYFICILYDTTMVILIKYLFCQIHNIKTISYLIYDYEITNTLVYIYCINESNLSVNLLHFFFLLFLSSIKATYMCSKENLWKINGKTISNRNSLLLCIPIGLIFFFLLRRKNTS